MSQPPFSSPSPARRLGLALLLSLSAHWMLFQVLARTRPGTPAQTVAGSAAAPLNARLLAPPRPLSQRPRPAPARLPAEAPAAPTPPALPPTPAPSPAADAVGTPTPPVLTEIPDSYLPLGRLTREPTLVTEVDPASWPVVPDNPGGLFRLELGIGPGGSVEVVIPRCEPSLCTAAGLYADIVRQWQFQPAEILGHPVPSRLILEFQIGVAAPPGTDQPLRQ